MAAMNSSVLACNYVISSIGSSEFSAKVASFVSSAINGDVKLPVIRAQQTKESKGTERRRSAMLSLAATLFAYVVVASSTNIGIIEDYLEKSKANKVQ